MRSDFTVASACELAQSTLLDSEEVAVSQSVYEGIRYITFAALPIHKFSEQYKTTCSVRDILRIKSNKRDGFANPHMFKYWLKVKCQVLTYVNEDKSMPVHLSGHGIGGSVALIAGYELVKKHYNVARCLTFGAPQALNPKDLIPWAANMLQNVTTQYVLPFDKGPKIFKLTKYKNVDRTMLPDDHTDLLPPYTRHNFGCNHRMAPYVAALGVRDEA